MSDHPENEKTATRSRLNTTDRRGFRIVKTVESPTPLKPTQSELIDENPKKDTRRKVSLLDYLENLADHVEKIASTSK